MTITYHQEEQRMADNCGVATRRAGEMKAVITLTSMLLLAGCANSTNTAADSEARVKSLQAELKTFTDDEALQKQRVAIFDELDYDFYSNQKWDKFSASHADNITVYYPDGSTTTGLYPQHIDMLRPLFVFAPDTKIREHPVAFGRGDWTCVVGVMEGTFSAPMPIGNGKTVPPTGNKFKLRMVTIGRWGPDGKMTEEHLFWDNQALLKQIGLAK